jgi:hypothetical protein
MGVNVMPKPKRESFGFNLTILILFWGATLTTIAGDIKTDLDATGGINGPVTRFLVPVALVFVIVKTDVVRFTWRFLTNTLPEKSDKSDGSGSSGTEARDTPVSAPSRTTLVVEGTSPEAKEVAKALEAELEPTPRGYRIFDAFFYVLVFVGAIYFVITLVNGGH